MEKKYSKWSGVRVNLSAMARKNKNVTGLHFSLNIRTRRQQNINPMSHGQEEHKKQTWPGKKDAGGDNAMAYEQ